MWIPNPLSQGSRIYLLFDPTHLFKNIYNNFRNKENFIYHSIVNKEETDVTLASFAHIRELFDIEKGNRPKMMAHKLSEKVINPFSIEKTNVRLADACFHESTIKALEYFGEHGYPWPTHGRMFIVGHGLPSFFTYCRNPTSLQKLVEPNEC